MKGFWKISTMSVVFCAALLSACQLQQSAGTLPNGAPVTDQKKAQLDAMKPQVDQLIIDVTGYDIAALATNSKAVSFEQMSKVKAGVAALLQKEFGSDYQKFIIEKELSRSVISNSALNTSGVSANFSPTVINTQIGYRNDSTPGFILYTCRYLYVFVNTTTTPYFSYNYVIQSLSNITHVDKQSPGGMKGTSISPFYAASQNIAIVDDGVQYNSIVVNNAASIYVIGKFVPGYYPPTASTVTTYHCIIDPAVYNGYVWLGWNWYGY